MASRLQPTVRMNRLVVVGLLDGRRCGVRATRIQRLLTGVSVVIYQNSDYGGDSRIMTTSVADLDDLPGCGGANADWNDCISSIRIPSSWEITVFEADNYAAPA